MKLLLKLKELYLKLYKSNPDIKPRQLQILVENSRRDNERLDQAIKVKQIRFAAFKPKLEDVPDQEYLFSASLLSSISQVINYK